jgi:ABC-2 type transport system ATP-binding protein
MKMPISCQNLTVAFSRVRAVNGLDLEVEPAAIYGLLGPNGAGKTTAIKAIMNIIRPAGGRSTVFGRDSRQLCAHDFEHIGYVSENQDLPGCMTVSYLMKYLEPFYPDWDAKRAAELLRAFDLPLNRKLSHFSRGMWMKAALASSLAYHPRLLVLDEPFSGLDPLVREELIQGILESAEECAILVSSHDLGEIETFASHIGYMEQGRLVFSEEMSSLTERFREVEVIVGQPSDVPHRSLWPARWLRPEVSPSLVRFIDTGFDLERTSAEVRDLFSGVRDISARPLPLRTIFLTMARRSREISGAAL